MTAYLYRQIKSDNDVDILQEDINKLCKWEKDWQMGFNTSKCFVMNVTQQRSPLQHQYMMGNTALEVVQHHPYLGVELSGDLDWKHHISNVTSKASRILGLLQRHLYDCTSKVKETAYKSLVRPRLEYCGNVWDPHTKGDKHALERVQRKAARFVTRDYKRESSVTAMLQSLKWKSLEERRAVSRLTFLYKAINNLIAFQEDKLPSFSTRSTRGSQPGSTFIPLHTKKDCYKYSLLPRTIPEWNLLPPSAKNALSTEIFKNELSNIDINDLINRARPATAGKN